MADLAENLKIARTRLSYTVARMEEAGRVRREDSPGGKRAQLAVLTDKGMAALEGAAPGHVALVRSAVFDRLTPGQARVFGEACEIILSGLTGPERPVLPLDKDGYYTGLFYFAFADVTATKLGSKAPVEAKDFLKSEFKDKLVLTYPNDDDAVLYYFKQLTDKYGFDYLKKLLAQNPKFVRGTQDSSDLVGTGDYVANFGSGGSASGLSQVTFPKQSPRVASPQTGAILRNAPHPAAAKLYLSWILTKGAQTNDIGTWSSRTDVAPPAGLKGIFDYSNMNPLGLGEFMSDRTALDRYKARINLYVGDVQGVNPSDPQDVLGLYPVSQNGIQG
ncbi:extracellular solute-binding protein [Streptomyces eurythermus]